MDANKTSIHNPTSDLAEQHADAKSAWVRPELKSLSIFESQGGVVTLPPDGGGTGFSS